MEDLSAAIARRREGVLPPLLHAEQPVARHRRRLRSGRGQEARREVLRRPSRPGRRSIGRRAGSRRSTASGSSRSADRVPQERTYIAWPAPEYFAADDAALEIAVADPRRRPVVAAEQGARLRQAARAARSTRLRRSQRDRAASSSSGDRARPASRSPTSRRIVTEEIALLAKDRPDRRPSSIAPGPSRSSSSSPASSASAASAARPIC